MMTTWHIPHEISMAHPIGPREGGSFPDSLPQTPSDPGAKKPQMSWHHGFPWLSHGNFGGNWASENDKGDKKITTMR